MERLNALEWADGLSFTAFGVRLGIRVTMPRVLEPLPERFPPGWRAAGTNRVQWLYSLVSVPSRRHPRRLIHTLYSGPDHLTQGSDFLRIRRILASDIQAQLALTSPWRVFVHAGAVGWKGRAILIPGDNEAGKSALTAAFLKEGATFLSDEFAVLDRKGRVHPYPLPLRLRSGESIRSTEVTPQALGGTIAQGPLPVGLILSVRYDPGGPGRIQRLSPGRGALELLLHATQARVRPRTVMEAVSGAAAGAETMKGKRGEAEAFAKEILSGLGR